MQQTIYSQRREKLATFLEKKRDYERILRKSKKEFPSIVDTATTILKAIQPLHRDIEREVRRLEKYQTTKKLAQQRDYSKFKINELLERAEIHMHFFKGYLQWMGHLEKYSQESESSLQKDIKGLPWNVYF